MKKLLSIIARSALAVWTFTGCNANVNTRSPVGGKKGVLYYIVNMTESDIFTNCSNSCAVAA
jgi:hypothetical protein